MDTIVSNYDFLSLVAKPMAEDSFLWTTFSAGSPNSTNFSWKGIHSRPDSAGIKNLDSSHVSKLNTYYSVSSYKPNAEGEIKRQKQFFDRMLVLVVDDADQLTLHGSPTYMLETSPGKFQVGIFLDESDADCKNIELCSALVTAMTERGMVGDKSGNAVTRYVRLPVGVNHKERESGPFEHNITHWEPETRLNLQEAAEIVGIDLEEIRKTLAKVKSTSVASAASEYAAAKEMGLVMSQSEKLPLLINGIMTGTGLHESSSRIASSLLRAGMFPGSIVNLLRALMENSNAPKDERWKARYEDIVRDVKSAEEKYKSDRAQEIMSEGRFAIDPTSDKIVKKDLVVKASSILEGMTPPKWVVKGLLEADALGLLLGAPGDGKSFLAFDIACSVATGTPWHGHKVKKGAVVYLAGEGKGGVARRLAAWQKQRGVSLEGAELYVSTTAVNLIDPEKAAEAVKDIEAMLPAGTKPILVIIDTVARAFVGGDENSSKDMGLFVNIVDTMIKARWGAHVLGVHHTGKDASKGARGSSALKGALDQEFYVDTVVKAKKLVCTKMKDAETPKPIAFRLESVFLEKTIDEFGDEESITSAVPTILSEEDIPVGDLHGRGRKSKSTNEATVNELIELMRDGGWPGLSGIQEYFECGRPKAMALVKKATELGLLLSHGEGVHKRYELSAECGFIQ